MKRISLPILMLISLLVLSSCTYSTEQLSGKEKSAPVTIQKEKETSDNEDTSEKDTGKKANTPKEAMPPDEHYTEVIPPENTAFSSDISQGITDHGTGLSYTADTDSDGKDEQITIETFFSDDSIQIMRLTVGSKSTTCELFDGRIAAAFLCDIDTSDKSKDIAVITVEGSDDPFIRIFSCADLSPYKFASEYVSGGSEYKALGYACSFYFNTNGNNSITMEEQTSCYGMWSVYKNYKLNKNGVFEEIERSEYNILPDFMKSREESLTCPKEEKEMWKKGFIKACKSYSNESISIAEGEYVQPLYDDGRELLYVKKENGTTGYINISYDGFPQRDEFNPVFFMMAG